MARHHINYASSGRASCRHCFSLIPKGALRFTHFRSRRVHHYHLDCFYKGNVTVERVCPSMDMYPRSKFKTDADYQRVKVIIDQAATKWKKRFGRTHVYPKELALLSENKLHAELKEEQIAEEVVGQLSCDAWQSIFQYLPVKNILSASSVSMGMYFIVNDDRLWNKLLKRESYPEAEINQAKKSLEEQGSKRAKFIFQKLYAELCCCCGKVDDNMQYLKPIKRSICGNCVNYPSKNPDYRLISKTQALRMGLPKADIKKMQGVKSPFQRRKDTIKYLYGQVCRRIKNHRRDAVLTALDQYDLLRPVDKKLLEEKHEEELSLAQYIDMQRDDFQQALVEYTNTWTAGLKTLSRKRKRSPSSTPQRKKAKSS